MPRLRRRSVAVVATALLVSLAGTSPVAAASLDDTVLTHGAVGGAAVAVGDVIESNLATGTTANFYSTATGTTGVKCAASKFSATVLTNPAAPGVATESLDAQSFSSCTSNVFGTLRVNRVSVDNLPYSTSVDSAGTVTISGGAAGPIQSTVVLATLLGTVTCVYQTAGNSLSGVSSNATTSISFVNQPFTKVAGPATCFSSAYFSATYAPVQDVSQAGSPTVYVN
ncbi:Tat pathway signal sequence domain protein [Micromonospora sp. KC723]|uniref:Tat pathway signal sequence domain protein n=1 Tax=Micromonospora sp. KC723 TaxID=2530381 RepID=UPI001044DA02|nr:Tat pathway signal sequence domain protein [Micromonospora sp. KC723]TDB76847.1 Tat pathway signal sequence domain protein [Micromonospora sp. KC723]